MYNEDYIRIGSGEHHPRPWNALAEFAKRFMEEYYPEDAEEMRRMSARYGRYGRYSGDRETMRYRNQPRTSTGRFKRVRFGHGMEDIEECKEMVGGMLAETKGKDWLIQKAIKEAGEFIEAASDRDEYEMFKEFAELCILMKGIGELIPEDLEEEACRKALEYYSKKTETMNSRYSNPLLDEYYRMNRPTGY
ncbi:MAG: hypothetical protein IJC21_04060 [Lentisphaeria bacterium]|nr:hypothetical protein [Lentisphaeria bacterium]